MKHKLWMNSLIGAGFAFLLSVSAVGNLATGCNLEVTSMRELFLWCACFSVISAFLFHFKYGGIVLLCLTVLAAPTVWKDGLLWEQLQTICYTVSRGYHNAYDWPIFGRPLTEVVDRPLIVLSAWSAFSVSWSVCRHKTIFVAMPSVILPLAICLITTDRVPDEIYLYLLILGIGMLLMTDWTRRKNPAQGSKLTLRLAIPMAAAMVLLFAMNPQEAYVNRIGKYQEKVVSWVEKLLETAEPVSPGVPPKPSVAEKVNLKYVGPQKKIFRAVMRVNAPFNGTVYLRGRDYDVYTGTGWEATANRQERFSSGGAVVGRLNIVTERVMDVLYVPYYSVTGIFLDGGALDNATGLREYSYAVSDSAYGDSSLPHSRYTELPADTLQWASGLSVIKDTQTLSQSEQVARIEHYVQSSATYDLLTLRMPPSRSDFARWFLEEADTGYCVHFATAATVLLRAAGIPARYVEGYAVSCKAGEEVVGSNLDEHAWAEYYDYSFGIWRVLEATPADRHREEETTPSTTPPATKPAPTEPEPSEPEEMPTIPQKNPQTQPTVPSGTEGGGSSEIQKPFTLPNWVKIVFRIAAAALLVPLQGDIRIAWKRRKWDRGRPNEKLIARWRQAKKMARIIKHPMPEELELLAQKASFSQHKIRSDELQLFEDYRKELLEAVRSKPWSRRLLLRWIFAIG